MECTIAVFVFLIEAGAYLVTREGWKAELPSAPHYIALERYILMAEVYINAYQIAFYYDI